MTRTATLLFSPLVGVIAVLACRAQDSTARARALLEDTSKSTAVVREELLKIGDAAVEPVLRALETETNAAQPRQAFLVGVLASVHSPTANRALGRALGDNRPFVRASAAIALGKSHERCAVPQFVKLLDDSAEYAKAVATDPYTERRLTVSSAAGTALEQIIGTVNRPNGDLRAASEKWWEQKRSGTDCTGWN